MTDKTHRSAVTGKFVTAEHAKTNPDTTVSESPCRECERLRGVAEALAAKLDAVREWIDRRGVNVDDRDDDYMHGYRDAQRHALLDAHDLRRVLDAPGVAIDGYREEVERLRAAEPIVRTVGDLTARHVGRRVRVEGCEYTLDHIGPSKCLFILGPGGYFPGQQFPLDAPCEVLG